MPRTATASQDDRDTRKTEYDSKAILALAESLKEQVKALEKLAADMKAGELGQVPVDGHKMMRRGLTAIYAFIDNARRAIREEAWESGRDSR